MNRYWVWVLPWFVLSSGECRVISIETQIQTTVDQDTLAVQVKITNRGDENANSIYVQTESPIASNTSLTQPGLAPGMSHIMTSQHSLKGLSPGQYPLIVLTHYADTNGYPFSALTVVNFQRGQGSGPTVAGTLEKADLQGKARSTLKVKNLETDTKMLHIRFLSPAELSLEPPAADQTLSPRQELNMPIVLKNFSGLPGSTYMVYAVMEYQQKNIHYTALAPTAIRVLEPSLFSNLTDHLGGILAVVVILVGLIWGRVFWGKRRSR